jgi:hypothetical protein
MSYYLKVIKDHPIGFWPLDESSGTVAVDISGCGNNATYIGSPAANMLPIIPGGDSGTKITNTSYITLPTSKDFYGSSVSNGLANKYSSDNDFTLELWVSQSIQSSGVTALLADITDGIGIYWENGDIIFKISNVEQIRWAVTYSKKAMHIVGVYSVNSISLYIDGTQVGFKTIDSNFKFTNTSFDLQIGPTSSSSDSFIVDAPCVYRYGLNSASILRHYNDANYYIQPIHVVNPEDGVLFSCSDRAKNIDFGYTYGVNAQWDDFIDSNTYYDDKGKYLAFIPTATSESKSFVINDFLFIPMESNLTDSKIEWRNELGVSVETSVDGTNYLPCVNGEAIPQYKKGSFNTSGLLYIRITMTTTDASKFLPRLSYFSIRFYTQSKIYADNFNSYIESSNQFAVGSLNYSPLLRHYNNGIRPNSGYGFSINTELNINTVEMFFTPKTNGANTLFYDPTTSTKYAWNGSGTVSKASISKVYVNGVDKTSQTNISNFLVAGEPHHIVLVLSSSVSGNLQFNYETSGGPDNLYNNIAIYNRALTQADVGTHFDLYCGRPASTTTDPVIDLTELSPIYYDNDWIVLQST